MENVNCNFSVEEAKDQMISYLSERINWKYLKSQRCFKKVINDLVFEISFFASKWNQSYDSVEVHFALGIWNKKLGKVNNVNSSIGYYSFIPPSDNYWWDISNETKLIKNMEYLASEIANHVISLTNKFEDDYLGTIKSLLCDELFDKYHIRLEFIALHFGNDFIADKAKSICNSLSDDLREQINSYRQGDRSKFWMINPTNLRYIVDNNLD